MKMALFFFVLPDSIKSCFLTVSYVGMKTDTVEVKSLPQNNLVIRMSSDARMLKGVTVVGSRQIFKNQGNIIVADVQNSILSKSGTINNLMNRYLLSRVVMENFMFLVGEKHYCT